MTDAHLDVHFLVGMPRGGTTFLLRRLQQHPEVLAFGESRFFGNEWVEPEEDGCLDRARLDTVRDRLLANPLNSNLPRPDDPKDRPGWIDHIDSSDATVRLEELFSRLEAPVTNAEVFREVCVELARGSGATTVIEKTPHHLRHVGRLVENFPQARILVVLRDPYDFLLSYKFSKNRRLDDEERRATDEMLWQATGVSLLWRSYLRAAVSAQERFGDAVRIVRLEDVRDNARTELDSIQAFFGLEPHDLLAGAPARDNSSFTGERPRLQPSEIAAFNAVAARDAERGGYQVVDSGLGRLRSAVATLGVVPWAIRNARSAAQRTDGGIWRYARSAVLRR